MLWRSFIFLFLLTGVVFAQPVQRDTSFTLHSAYVKTKKTHPGISIAKAVGSADNKVDSNVVYCDYGDRKLYADVFSSAPKKSQHKPAVLLIFGGGWRSGNRSMNNALAQELASKGFVAVSVDYRLSTEALYPAAVHDLKAAIRWMRANAKKYHIDKNKIAVLGCSAGGQLAALVGNTNNNPRFEGETCHTEQRSTVQAIVDIDGVLAFIHPESGEGNESKGPSAATLWFGGTKEQKTDLWNEASPLNHVSKSSAPILFINSGVARMHGGRDDMRRKLDSLNIYSEVHSFPEAPHPFWLFNPWFKPTIDYTINFLNKVFHINTRK